MNVNVEEEDKDNFIKDARARSNACFKCGEMGHFQHDCQYNGDKPSDTKSVDKNKKCIVIFTPSPVASTSTCLSSNLRNEIRDKAKVTAALIQELTEELQSIDQETLNDEQ